MTLFTWADLEWLEEAHFPHFLFHGSSSTHSPSIDAAGWRRGVVSYDHKTLSRIVTAVEEGGWTNRLHDEARSSLHWVTLNLKRARNNAGPCFTTRLGTATIFASLPGGETIKNCRPLIENLRDLCRSEKAPVSLRELEHVIQRLGSDLSVHWNSTPVIYVVRATLESFPDWCRRRDQMHAYGLNHRPTNDDIEADGDVAANHILGKCTAIPENADWVR